MVQPQSTRLKWNPYHWSNGRHQVGSLQSQFKRHATARRKPGREYARAIDLQLRLQLVEDATNIGDVDPLARVWRKATPKKTTFG